MLRKLNADSRHTWLPLPAAILILLGGGLANATEPTTASRYAVEQPSQDLGEALRAIARQTNTSVLFDPRAVAGRRANAVSGRLSGAEAISAAVNGTGLLVHVTQDGAVVVRAMPSPAALPASPASGGALMRKASDVHALAALESGPSAILGADTEAGEQAVPGRVEELTRVEITGSRLRRVEAEGPAPVNVYTTKDIERSGQPSLQRFLAGLNEVSASTGEGGFGSTLGQGTVQLRGLPLGSTLVLINGRKVQGVGSSSGSVFNLNLIPMAAIDRVEVVPLGSSAVYGGDALAGVVNVILKKSIDRLSVTARLGSGRGFGDGSLSVATGGRSADGRYLLMGSYSRSSPLSTLDRTFFRDADYRRLGGTDGRMSYCAPGTVSSVNGANLPGLGASVAGIPEVAPGQSPGVSDFETTAGKQNLCNVYTTGGGIALFHGYETLAVHALAEQRIFDNWSAFGELTYAKDRMQAQDIGLTLTGVTVPASNPFNPFGVDVRVTAVLGPDNGMRAFARQSNFTRVLAGLKGEIANKWDVELTASTSSDRGGAQTHNDVASSAALSSALASTTAANALNLFTGGRSASDSVLRGIWSDTLRTNRGRKDQVSGIARGTIGELWAGPVEAVVGAETARDWYDVSVPGQSETHGTRSSSAAYGELRAPLLSSGQAAASAWSLAAVTLAARRDRYSDFGSASTFQAGLEVRPSRGLLIRGSVATSFKPPTILQTHVEDATFQAALFGLVDPARAGERISSGTVLRTTNKDLAPERGRSRGIGVAWEPEGRVGARVSATYWQVRIRDMIAVLRPQSSLDYESLFPGFVTRGPAVNGQPGAVTSIKTAEANFGRVDTEGTDVDLGYAWKASVGRVTAAAGATRTGEYQVTLAPGAPTVDRLGRRFTDFWAPRWKGRVSIGLDDRIWNLGLTSRYIGAYKDAGTSDRRLGDTWTHDLAGGVNLKKLWPDLLPGFKDASFALSIANLTDREPQFVQVVPYYDVTQADWRGRYVSARLSLDW